MKTYIEYCKLCEAVSARFKPSMFSTSRNSHVYLTSAQPAWHREQTNAFWP